MATTTAIAKSRKLATNEAAPGISSAVAYSAAAKPIVTVGASKSVPASTTRKGTGKSMSKIIEWQPLVFIKKATASGEVIQHESLWLDTQSFSTVVLNVRVIAVDASKYLYIESSDQLGGPWDTVAGSDGKLISEGATVIVLSRNLPESDPNRLRRYLRWRIEGGDTETCFFIRVELKS